MTRGATKTPVPTTIETKIEDTMMREEEVNKELEANIEESANQPPQTKIDEITMKIGSTHVIVDRTDDPFKDQDNIVDNLATKNLVDYPSFDEEREEKEEDELTKNWRIILQELTPLYTLVETC